MVYQYDLGIAGAFFTQAEFSVEVKAHVLMFVQTTYNPKTHRSKVVGGEVCSFVHSKFTTGNVPKGKGATDIR